MSPGEQLGPGQIYDSNRTTLMAALREQGFVTVDLGVARDRQGTCDQAVAVSVVGVCTMFLDFIGVDSSARYFAVCMTARSCHMIT